MEPKGQLTDVQQEIMEIFWAGDENGMKPADVWVELRDERDVARTTILTLLKRLEQRGWIKRIAKSSPAIYVATVSKQEASSTQASNFLDAHFEGSASQLISSLLGNGRVSKAELTRLRKLLNQKTGKKSR